jgi:pimeloyl-ACP methyl ester carboxylesterase
MTKQIIFNSAAVSYRISGQGMPVLLLHGFAEDGSVWDTFKSELEKKYLLLIPELPGTGDSDMPPAGKESLEYFADVIIAILDAEGIEQCCLVGHSMGGYTGVALAHKYPRYLSGIAFYHSSAYADDADKVAARRKGIKFIEQNGGQEFLKTSIPGLFYDKEKSKTDIENMLTKGTRFTDEALIMYYNAMIRRPDHTETIQHFHRPVGFFLGEHDQAVPFALGLRQSHIPKVSLVYIFRSSAHMSMLEEPTLALTHLQNFLRYIHQNDPAGSQ